MDLLPELQCTGRCLPGRRSGSVCRSAAWCAAAVQGPGATGRARCQPGDHLAAGRAARRRWSARASVCWTRLLAEAGPDSGTVTEAAPATAAARPPPVVRAIYGPLFVPRRRVPSSARPAQRHALIVGAGLAGCAVACALAEQGWRSTLVDRHDAPAQEGSGNPAGLFHGIVNVQDGAHARFNRAAALQAQHAVQLAIDMHGAKGGRQGLLRLETSGKDTSTMRAELAALQLPSDYVQALDAAEASRRCGLPLQHPAWFYPGGGWVDPAALARSFAAKGRRGHAVSRFIGGDGLASPGCALATAGWRGPGHRRSHHRRAGQRRRCLAPAAHHALALAAGARADQPVRQRGGAARLADATADTALGRSRLSAARDRWPGPVRRKQPPFRRGRRAARCRPCGEPAAPAGIEPAHAAAKHCASDCTTRWPAPGAVDRQGRLALRGRRSVAAARCRAR